MAKPPIVDAQFEVISGPLPVTWQKRLRRRAPDALKIIRWIPIAAILFAVALTVLALALGGGDL